jgi:uncharacterized transporter YbjL
MKLITKRSTYKKPTTADLYMRNLKTLHKLKVLVDRIYADEHLKQPELSTALFDSCDDLKETIRTILYLQRARKEKS